jgi:hypothetical protein
MVLKDIMVVAKTKDIESMISYLESFSWAVQGEKT